MKLFARAVPKTSAISAIGAYSVVKKEIVCRSTVRAYLITIISDCQGDICHIRQ